MIIAYTLVTRKDKANLRREYCDVHSISSYSLPTAFILYMQNA